VTAVPVPDAWVDILAEAVWERLRDRLEPPPVWPEWMSVRTAATYLDWPPERLSKLAQRDQIPYVQECKHGRLSFNRHALDNWMYERSKPRGTCNGHSTDSETGA
jgi:hypothetical protein